MYLPIHFLIQGSSQKAFPHLNSAAGGYVFDFTEKGASANVVHKSYGLIEGIKNKYVFGENREKQVLSSHKVVVFANFLPNMKCFSMDRWSFFHTTLGQVFFHCEKASRGTYKCSISRKNKSSNVNPQMKLSTTDVNTDQQLTEEYHYLFGADLKNPK